MLESLEKKVSTFMFSDTEKNHFPLCSWVFNFNKFVENIHRQCVLLYNYIICPENTLFVLKFKTQISYIT